MTQSMLCHSLIFFNSPCFSFCGRLELNLKQIKFVALNRVHTAEIPLPLCTAYININMGNVICTQCITNMSPCAFERNVHCSLCVCDSLAKINGDTRERRRMILNARGAYQNNNKYNFA